MPLYLVATPIGNTQDISLRALEILRSVNIIILEEYKESTAFLRAHGITAKQYEQLNEHSTTEDLQNLLKLCRSQDIALITDCGTPGFADPGTALVKLCRSENIPIHAVPGASSLMTLLSLSSERLDQFVFRGFLSAETSKRKQQWQELRKEKHALIIMDTPYRFKKTVAELVEFFPDRKVLLTLNLTQSSEQILEGKPEQIKNKINLEKAEFMLLIYPQKDMK